MGYWLSSNILHSTCPPSLPLTCQCHFCLLSLIFFVTDGRPTFTDPPTFSFLMSSFFVTPHSIATSSSHSPPMCFLGFSLTTVSARVCTYNILIESMNICNNMASFNYFVMMNGRRRTSGFVIIVTGEDE